MTLSLINLNGTLIDPASTPEAARVSVYDRSFLYGDSLYEVARSYQGRLYQLEEHLERLYASAKLCRLAITQTPAELRAEILRTVGEFAKRHSIRPGSLSGDVYCRWVVSRGVGQIGFGLSKLRTPSQFVIYVHPVEEFTGGLGAAQFERGLCLAVASRLRNDRRALDPAMKSGNYLNSLLAYLEEVPQSSPGADTPSDAILCGADGFVTEGTTFNIFYVRRGIIATPPLEVGILDGITRRTTIRLARGLGREVREVRFGVDRLLAADEVFATSSLKEVFPVTALKLPGDPLPRPVGAAAARGARFGQVGAVTRDLAAAFRSEVRAWLATAG